jgi:hypothetical protein
MNDRRIFIGAMALVVILGLGYVFLHQGFFDRETRPASSAVQAASSGVQTNAVTRPHLTEVKVLALANQAAPRREGAQFQQPSFNNGVWRVFAPTQHGDGGGTVVTIQDSDGKGLEG